MLRGTIFYQPKMGGGERARFSITKSRTNTAQLRLNASTWQIATSHHPTTSTSHAHLNTPTTMKNIMKKCTR